MNDQTIPADKVRELIAFYRDGASDRGGMILADLEALLPTTTRPTLDDMTDKERDACRGMQADVEGMSGRYVIIHPRQGAGAVAAVSEDGEIKWFVPGQVTPRPDLPRLEWPGNKQPDPAPALPDGWRLAEHPDHGRVIVTRTEPDRDGEVPITVPVPPDDFAARFEWCRPAELTYLDQEVDTSDTVPENTLAVGSAWEDVDALTLACKESERDQITVIDKRGIVGVWDAGRQGWRAYAPNADFSPFTILHIGKPVAP